MESGTDIDDCGQDNEELFINDQNMHEAKPLICWGRGLPKPKVSDIPNFQMLSLMRPTFKENDMSKRPAGRGRGASYKSKTLNECTADERIWPETYFEGNREISSAYLQQYENAKESDIIKQEYENGPFREQDYQNVKEEYVLPKQEHENAKENSHFVKQEYQNVEEEYILSNNHDPSRSDDLNHLDNDTKGATRLSCESQSLSSESISFVDRSKTTSSSSERNSPVSDIVADFKVEKCDDSSSNDGSKSSEQRSSHLSHELLQDNLAGNFSDSSDVKVTNCDRPNVIREKTKKINVRKAKMHEKQKIASVGLNKDKVNIGNRKIARVNKEPNAVTGCPNIKRHSPSKSSMYKKKEIFKECSKRKYLDSSSDTSSAESINLEAENDVRNFWGSVTGNLNKVPNKGARKQKWEDCDFPSLDSASAASSNATFKIAQQKKTEGLNLKSVAESLLQPISGSCTDSSSGERGSPPPGFLKHLTASDRNCFTIKFAVENIPGYIEEDWIRDILEPYGNIVDLQLEPCGDSLRADVTMKSESEPKEIIGHLDGTPLFGASSQNVKVYLL